MCKVTCVTDCDFKKAKRLSKVAHSKLLRLLKMIAYYSKLSKIENFLIKS